ncbi:hypothetical protein FEZ51_01890 [Pediococcus stilesii]|uniref:Uncharacterized protein n=1 Tax=Pediococcus stilesii TaxID=331679 RepID=A0A5R9BY54_9LACO|nr:hypothetical protein [Pediococcus stilesii]TLQ05435.1 hypothetical protein FEZ51_01890 [Pediococcus stilesii]
MNKEELEEYLEANSGIKEKFMDKALDYQVIKNKNRQPAKRWEFNRVEREAEKMYNKVLDSIYDKLKTAIKSSDSKKWKMFIDENYVFEDLEDSMSEMVFE